MSSIVEVENPNKRACLILHPWFIIEDTGFTEYKICSRCGHGKMSQFGNGYQPMDESVITDLHINEEYKTLPGKSLE